MVGVYSAQLSVNSNTNGKNFMSTFTVTINPCIVTSYSLIGCSYLGYILLEPPKNDSCIKISQVPSCQYDSTVGLTGVLSSIMTASVSNKDTVDTVILYNTDKALIKVYPVQVKATLVGYSYSSSFATVPFAVNTELINPCYTSTIPV